MIGAGQSTTKESTLIINVFPIALTNMGNVKILIKFPKPTQGLLNCNNGLKSIKATTKPGNGKYLKKNVISTAGANKIYSIEFFFTSPHFDRLVYVT